MAGLVSLDGQEPSVSLCVQPAAVSTSQTGVTPPPMGWASWNSFFGSIDSTRRLGADPDPPEDTRPSALAAAALACLDAASTAGGV